MIVLYLFLRLLVRATLRIFYKEFSVNGRERFPRKGPMIVVANHPNTLMDPLVVASLLHQQVGFMGNGSLFRNKALGKLLRFFNVIPVYRKQDIRPGETIDNQDNFEHAREWLGKGGTILIFPEGTSFAEKKLRELRTGASRIALSFEKSRDFKGGLVVMPATLNYSAPTRFRTRLRIDVGTPIPVRNFADLHAQDEAAAMRALTEAQREQMAERMVILEDKSQERMHGQILRLHREWFHPQKGMPALKAEMELADRIRDAKAIDPAAIDRLQVHLDQWFAMMDRLQISEGFFKRRFRKWNAGLLWGMQFLLLILGSLPYLLGLLTNWTPYWFPGWIAPKISDEVEYHAPTMMVIGMFLFPIWYGLILLTLCLLGVGGWWLLAIGAALPILGAFALYYERQMEHWEGLSSLLLLKGRKKSLVERLDEERNILVSELLTVLGNLGWK